jgi:hypothetical protein
VTRRLRLPYTPHAAQLEVHAALERDRFVVLAAGRRWGKSWLGLNHALRTCLTAPEREVRVTSPVFGQAKSRFRAMRRLLRDLDPALVERVHQGDLRIQFKNESAIQFWSTAEPDNLRGEGVHLLIVDEAGYVVASTWHEVLRPMLSDTAGRALVIGTPHGKRQLLHELYLRGEAGIPGWRSFRFPTSANPRIPAEEIAAARAEFPSDAFRQEYECEFLDSAAGVFKGVSSCIGGELEGPRPDRRYVVGVDLAAVQDFSVIAALEVETGQIVHFDRFRGVSYVHQVPRILDAARRYNNATLVVDETGVGRPVLDALRAILGRSREPDELPRAGGLRVARPDVVGVVLTNEVKQDAVTSLQLAIERRRIRIPASCADLIRELDVFGYEMLPSGRVRYAAPAGFHDDCVIALALAVHAMPRGLRRVQSAYNDTRFLIEHLSERVHRPRRYTGQGPAKQPGLVPYSPGPPTNDLISELRLFQVCREAGLVADDESAFLEKDLRRRLREVRLPFSTDPLDERFGTLDDFINNTRPSQPQEETR